MRYKIIGFVLAGILLSSCQRAALKENTADVVALADRSSSTPTALKSAGDLYANGKRVIKTANYRFEVKDVNEATATLEQSILRFGAFIATSNLNEEDNRLESKVSIRVQQEYFQDLLKEIDKLAARVNFRNITTNDVSKDFVDLESRLKTKREVEQRYMEILRKNAGTIEELLDAEKQIGSLHEEIEATISRMNYLKDQVSYSTIDLEYYQPIVSKPDITEETFAQKLSAAFSSGLTGIKHVLLVLVNVWPFVLAVAIGYVVIIRKKKTMVSASKSQPS